MSPTGPMDIAVVLSKVNIDPKSKYMDTYNAISNAIADDNRYLGARVSAVSWDVSRDWSRYTHILLSGGVDYAHCRQQFLDWMRNLPEQSRRRVFNPLNVIEWNIDKIYLLNYKKQGVRMPATVFIRPGDTPTLQEVTDLLQKQMENSPLDTIVVKNMVDAGGHSVQLTSIARPEKAEQVLNKALETYAQSGVIIQQFLPAIKTEGEWSLIFFDRKLSHAVIKVPSSAPEGFKVQSRFGGSHKPVELSDVPSDIVEFGKEVIDATEGEQLLYARVDILRNLESLPCLMELEAFEPDLYFYNKSIAQNFIEVLSSY